MLLWICMLYFEKENVPNFDIEREIPIYCLATRRPTLVRINKYLSIENPIYSMSEKHHRRKIMSTYWLIEHDELKLRSLPLFLPPMIAIFVGLFYWDSLPNINTNYSIFVGIWRQRGFPFLSNGFYRYKTLNGTRVLSE